jgi:phosphatidylserine/phosphatidylglycerophosphate/cardiolipin synthase-like enzyme
MIAIMNVTTLTDGGQQPLEIARPLQVFLAAARTSLDIAVYDLNLGPETEVLVVDAIQEAARRGVAVRIAYNADHRAPIPVPPPPKCAPEDIERLDVPTKAIAGIPDLMHHKYVVRDGATVWTGSTNWTDDSWSREENVIAVVESAELAHAFTLDFEQLWAAGAVEDTGKVEPRPVEVDGVEVRPWFCPGFGDALSHRIAKHIGRAKRRVRICSPVITAAPVLATLAQVVADGKVDVLGAVDQTQIEEVRDQWGPTGVASWKLPLLRSVIASGHFAGKRSTPWGPGTVHDYMHAKITVADDVVFLGSFNLSHSGEQNAENVLEIHDRALAERLAAFIEGVNARYPIATLEERPARGGPLTPKPPT